jgi:phage gp29-like protein
MKSNKILTNELVTRDSQYSFFRHIGILPNPDMILSRTGKTIEAYRELKNDPHVWSCIQSRKSGVLSLDHTINRSEAGDFVHRTVERAFAEIDLDKFIRDILEAPLFGFQPFEIVWKPTGGRPNILLPESIKAKPQEWFVYSPEGVLKRRVAGSPKGASLPEYKFINVQYESDYLNPYGHALLGKCYWPVTFKNGGLRFWVNFMERYGMPVMIGQYNRGASSEEVEKLAAIMADMTEDSVIVSPSDVDIKLQEAARNSSVNLYQEMISHCNAEISKALLSQTLTTEIDGGSYAAAMIHYRIRADVVKSDIRIVEYAVNQLIKYIVKINFRESPSPVFRMITNDSDNPGRLERDIRLAENCGVRFTKKYWINNYGLRSEDFELDD